MKVNLKTMLFLCIFSLFSFACSQRRDYKIKETEKNQNSDSLVSLSFMGIKLADKYSDCINEAIKTKQILNAKKSNHPDGMSASCIATAHLTLSDGVVPVELKITSFQDTITSFIIVCKNEVNSDKIRRLYRNKYKNPEYMNKDDDWGQWTTRKTCNYISWKYKNQSIEMADFGEETRENYVKDPTKKAAQNRYGVRYSDKFIMQTIIYSDYEQCEKVANYEAKERDKRAKIEQVEKAKKEEEKRKLDSIKNLKVLNQDF